MNADLTALYFGDYLVLERVALSRWCCQCGRCGRVRVIGGARLVASARVVGRAAAPRCGCGVTDSLLVTRVKEVSGLADDAPPSALYRAVADAFADEYAALDAAFQTFAAELDDEGKRALAAAMRRRWRGDP